MTFWDYSLWNNFDDLLDFDKRGTSFYSQMNDLCKEFVNATKSYGTGLKKISDKYYRIRITDYYNDDRLVFGSILEWVRDLGILLEGICESYNQHDEIFNLNFNSFKSNNKKAQQTHEQIFSKISKEELYMRTRMKEQRDALVSYSKAHKKLRDSQKAKSGEDLEKLETDFKLKNEIYSRVTETCRNEVKKFNNLRKNCLSVEMDALIKDMNFQTKRRVESERDLLDHFHNVLRIQYGTIYDKIKDLSTMGDRIDKDKVVGEMSTSCIKRELPEPIVPEDFEAQQGSQDQLKRDKIIGRIYDLANKRAKLTTLRNIYNSNQKLGSISKSESMIGKMDKNLSSAFKKLAILDESSSTKLLEKISKAGGTSRRYSNDYRNEFSSEYDPIFAVVKTDYISTCDKTISVKTGERLEILCEGTRIGWHYVSRCDGDEEQGYVPTDCLQIEGEI